MMKEAGNITTAGAVGRKTYRLIGADGRQYLSDRPGAIGGHRKNKAYGRLDCPSALRWIAKGFYVRHRVFFADEAAAVAAGYRPCARCMPEAYRRWKAAVDTNLSATHAKVT